jgi:hypothetical protein
MDDSSNETMRDVEHTPPEGEDVTNVWERGIEDADPEQTEE